MPARTLADSRVSAQVTLRQEGFDQRKVKLTVSESGKPLASQEVTLRGGGQPQTESILLNAGVAGAKTLQITVEHLDGEENEKNNAVMRLVNVEALKPRILYFGGEPGWELKFVRRAAEEDRSLQFVSMVRTTQNKIYRQGISDPKELEQGFPATAEELFSFQGLILANVEASYFTPAQQDLIRQFVDRRGGGLLFLGRTRGAGGWRLRFLRPVRVAAGYSPRQEGHLPQGPGEGRADRAGPRQPAVPLDRTA